MLIYDVLIYLLCFVVDYTIPPLLQSVLDLSGSMRELNTSNSRTSISSGTTPPPLVS